VNFFKRFIKEYLFWAFLRLQILILIFLGEKTARLLYIMFQMVAKNIERCLTFKKLS
jgi:hypothetical protein